MEEFKLYDIVSRCGDDEQIVIAVELGIIECLCIKANGTYRIGQIERNLPRRYDFIRSGSKSDIPQIEDASFEEVTV